MNTFVGAPQTDCPYKSLWNMVDSVHINTGTPARRCVLRLNRGALTSARGERRAGRSCRRFPAEPMHDAQARYPRRRQHRDQADDQTDEDEEIATMLLG